MSSPRLTRRGRAVAAICLVGTGMALAAGGRSLEAVVLPGVVALAAGYLQLARIDDPAVERTLPSEGFVGESREVRLAFRGSGPSGTVSPTYLADVTDALDDGIAGPADPIRTSVGDAPATYRVRYLRRGERRFGPVTVTAGDVFGLFERRTVVDESDAVLAYPPCRRVPAWFRRALYADDAVGASRQREEFDRLREYARGDRPRDVHWPATAKHGEVVVKAFAAETERGRVSIAGEATGGPEGADALASATASLALALLDDGVPVDVRLPSGAASADPGPRGRRTVLGLAARTGPGSTVAEGADVRVIADGRGARFRVDDRTIPFEEVAGETERTTPGPRSIRGASGDGTASTGASPARRSEVVGR
ncbi:DUF58 domain-containing protein [Halorubrum sp. AD140]|uniref:DUF58 domain-containing protein n=1 Tax=Halorubrum sp. AD140 TaxID=3050073 RepID=UPI002ACD1019|nr:DUF58 domain-containing protein [Halorubrum sp. AD140]MDZ5810740.1 DUF58 domain-containing protein [Halorubrum sp. AD140]